MSRQGGSSQEFVGVNADLTGRSQHKWCYAPGVWKKVNPNKMMKEHRTRIIIYQNMEDMLIKEGSWFPVKCPNVRETNPMIHLLWLWLRNDVLDFFSYSIDCKSLVHCFIQLWHFSKHFVWSGVGRLSRLLPVSSWFIVVTTITIIITTVWINCGYHNLMI